MGFKLPIDLPVSLSVSSTKKGFQLPISLPFTLSSSSDGETTKNGIRLPIRLPFTLSTSSDEETYKTGIQLPIRLPFRFGKVNTDDIYYQKKLKLLTQPSDSVTGQVFLRISERPAGAPNYLPLTETVWYFPGLIVDENIVTKKHNELLVDERIYSQIVASFELLSPTSLKLSWTGSKVPRVQIYMKSLESEDYTLYNTYAWNRGSITIPISDQTYYIKIVGIRDSGSSSEYMISPSLQLAIQPELEMVPSTDKIYNIDVNYTTEYQIDVVY